MSKNTLPKKFLPLFIKTVTQQLGQDNLSAVLEKASLPSEFADLSKIDHIDGSEAAEAYAGLQKAIRIYYGRGARGILFRVGSNMWTGLLDSAPLSAKAQSTLVRGLPVKSRSKPTLELLANLLSAQKGDVTVHTLDLDLLLADHASPGTLGQSDEEPVCYLTQGLIREALYWATGHEHDIEETSCRARGEDSCEFKITMEN